MDYTIALNNNIQNICFNVGDHYYLLGKIYKCYFYDYNNKKNLSDIRNIKLNNNKIIFEKGMMYGIHSIIVPNIISQNLLHGEIQPLRDGIWRIEYIGEENNISIFREEKIET